MGEGSSVAGNFRSGRGVNENLRKEDSMSILKIYRLPAETTVMEVEGNVHACGR